jgi:hypothetical protein
MQQQTPAQPAYVITDADKARQTAIANAWAAYDGLLPEQLKKTPDGVNPNVTTNRCEPIVNAGVNFLFGKPVGITIDQAAPQAAQEFLEKIWGKNEKRLPLLQDVEINGALSGRAFLRIVPDNKGNFRLIVVDPSTVFTTTAPQDCETVLLYAIEYSMTEKVNGKDAQVFYREEITRIDPDGNARQGMPDSDDTWSIQHWTRVGERGPWTPAGEPIAWPYSFPPLFSCKNRPRPNDFWGRPDITADLIGLNKAINLAQSCANLVQLLYGTPILYANGVAVEYLSHRPGEIIGMPTIEGKISSVAIVSDLANALAAISDLRSDMDEQSAVPAVVLGRITALPKGQLSGITMELMFQPLTQKTETKRCLYGELIIDVSKALLKLGHFSDDIDISLQWQNPLPDDDLASVQAAQGKQALGVSNKTLIQELGYDADMEEDANDAETAKAMTKFSQGVGMPPPGQVAQQPGQPTQPAQPAPSSPFIGSHS